MEKICRFINELDRYNNILILFDDGYKTLEFFGKTKRTKIVYFGKHIDLIEKECLSYYAKPFHCDYGQRTDSILYLPGCDIMNNDIGKAVPGPHLFKVTNAVAYNSLGFIKNKFKPVKFTANFRGNHGIYIREKALINLEHRFECFKENETKYRLVEMLHQKPNPEDKFRVIYVHYEQNSMFVFNMINYLLRSEGFLIVDKLWLTQICVKSYLENNFRQIFTDNDTITFVKTTDFFPKILSSHDNIFLSWLPPNLFWKKLVSKHNVLKVGDKWTLPCLHQKYSMLQKLGRLLKFNTIFRNNVIEFEKISDSIYQVASKFESFPEFCTWTKKVAKNHWVICTPFYQSEEHLPNYFANLKLLTDWLEKRKDSYTLIFGYSESTDHTYKMLLEFCRKRENYVILEVPRFGSYRTVDIATARNMLVQVVDQHLEMTKQLVMFDANYINRKKLQTDILEKVIERNDWDALFFNNRSVNDNFYDIWALSYDPYYLSCWSFGNSKVLEIIREDIKDKLQNLGKDDLFECLSAFSGFGIYRFEKFRNCSYSGILQIDRFYNFNIENNIRILQQKNFDFHTKIEWDCEHKYFHLDAIEKHGARIRMSPDIIFQ